MEWTIVRPAQLTNGPLQTYRSGEDISATTSSSAVSRTSVASFVLDTIDDATYVGARPNIMGG
ncbi:MAG: NAD(P)H-binding protein [Propionibacteriaceae bacterium]|nr:NAD(P)H-binding protein [Propionibacteriaceae bacterium]